MPNVSVTNAATPPRHQPLRHVVWRVVQFCHVVGARNDPAVDRRLEALLDNDDQWRLLRRLSPFDRAHHLRVHELLRERGCDDEDVLRAALLHDVGKADERGRAHAGHRTAKVLLGVFGAPVLERVALPAGRGPRHGLYLALHHAELGSALARSTGASERCCRLIARHDDRDAGADASLAMLIAADEGSIR
jgi:putative nucleotidyltransferase with HDIG domain